MRNSALVARAIELGADLDEKRNVDFSFLANSQNAAAALGIGLYEFGMKLTHMGPTSPPGQWIIEASAEVSICQATNADTTEQISKIAERAGATFDGVGFSV